MNRFRLAKVVERFLFEETYDYCQQNHENLDAYRAFSLRRQFYPFVGYEIHAPR